MPNASCQARRQLLRQVEAKVEIDWMPVGEERVCPHVGQKDMDGEQENRNTKPKPKPFELSIQQYHLR